MQVMLALNMWLKNKKNSKHLPYLIHTIYGPENYTHSMAEWHVLFSYICIWKLEG